VEKTKERGVTEGGQEVELLRKGRTSVARDAKQKIFATAKGVTYGRNRKPSAK